MDVVVGLESDFEEIKTIRGTPSTARSASAKAGLRIRSGREAYIELVERSRAGESITNWRGPDGEGAADLLAPLLLLLNHRDAPAAAMCAALSGVHRYVRADLGSVKDKENILQILETLVTRKDTSLDAKIIQTVTLLMRPVGLNLALLKQCIKLIVIIIDENAGNPLKEAAFAALDQSVMLICESLVAVDTDIYRAIRILITEICLIPVRNNDATNKSMLPSGGGSVVENNNKMITTTTPWITPGTVSNKYCLELLDSILGKNRHMFLEYPELQNDLRTKIAPLVLNMLRGRYARDKSAASEKNYAWSLHVRLMRLTSCLLQDHYRKLLVVGSVSSEGGVVVSGSGDPPDVTGNTSSLLNVEMMSSLFSSILALIEDGTDTLIVTPVWHRMLTLETILLVIQSNSFVVDLLAPSRVEMLRKLIAGLSKIVVSFTNVEEIDKIIEEFVEDKKSSQFRGLNLLSDVEPPNTFTAPMIALTSLECLIILADFSSTSGTEVNVGKVGPILLRRNSFSTFTQQQQQPQQSSLAIMSKNSTTGNSATSSEGGVVVLLEEANTNELLLLEQKRLLLDLIWKPLLSACGKIMETSTESSMIQYVLKTYLAMLTNGGNLKSSTEIRDAYLTSLCKFAIPTPPTKKNKQQQALSVKNMQVLKTSFNIAHGLGNILGSSWFILLEVFEHLDDVISASSLSEGGGDNSGLNIGKHEAGNSNVLMEDSSSYLEGSMNKDLLDVKDVEIMLKNVFDSSRFLNNDAIKHMMIGLSDLIFTSLAHASAATASNNNNNSTSPSQQGKTEKNRDAGGALDSGKASSQLTAKRLFGVLGSSLNQFKEKSSFLKTFTDASGGGGDEDNSEEENNNSNSNSNNSAERLKVPPFSLEKLVEITELNATRIPIIWDIVGSTLITVASCQNDKLRLYAVKSLEKLVILGLGNNTTKTEEKKELIKKFTELIKSSYVDTKEAALVSMYRLVSASGHQFLGLWNLFIAELLIVSTLPGANKNLMSSAFKVVQLIMDDYRQSLDAGCLPSLALCLRAFGEQLDDVNMSLTAIHHLWLLCEKADEGVTLDAETNLPTKESLARANALWLHVFDQLKSLSLDSRMEVRNSALRSLCTNIVATGDRLTVESWKTCALNILLPLIDTVDEIARKADGESQVVGQLLASHSEVRMTIHHSRDTEEKQWRETRVTALQGSVKIICGIILQVPNYKNLDWFYDKVWTRTLSACERCLHHGINVNEMIPREIVVAGISSFEELCLLVCGVGNKSKYAVPGMRVVNGTLINPEEVVDSAGFNDTNKTSLNDHTWLWPSLLSVIEKMGNLEKYQFDNEVASLFINSIGELYDSKRTDRILRSDETMTIVLNAAFHITKTFAKPSSRFITSLERSFLHLYKKITPSPQQVKIWKLLFANLKTFCEKSLMEEAASTPKKKVLQVMDPPLPTNSESTTTTNNNNNVSEVTLTIVEGDDFASKAGGAYLEILSTAPNLIRVNELKEFLNNDYLPKQILQFGLDAFGGSGIFSSEIEDIWIKLLERSNSCVDQVLSEDGVELLLKGSVPTAIRGRLVDLIVQRGCLNNQDQVDVTSAALASEKFLAGLEHMHRQQQQQQLQQNGEQDEDVELLDLFLCAVLRLCESIFQTITTKPNSPREELAVFHLLEKLATTNSMDLKHCSFLGLKDGVRKAANNGVARAHLLQFVGELGEIACCETILNVELKKTASSILVGLIRKVFDL